MLGVWVVFKGWSICFCRFYCLFLTWLLSHTLTWGQGRQGFRRIYHPNPPFYFFFLARNALRSYTPRDLTWINSRYLKQLTINWLHNDQLILEFSFLPPTDRAPSLVCSSHTHRQSGMPHDKFCLFRVRLLDLVSTFRLLRVHCVAFLSLFFFSLTNCDEENYIPLKTAADVIGSHLVLHSFYL